MPLRLNPTFRDVLAARGQVGASSDPQSDALGAAGAGSPAGTPRPLAGIWVCSASPVMAEICAGAGMDWLLIDMEHSPNGLTSVLSQLQAVAAYPVTPVVRVPSGDPVVLKQVLDLGAQNVLVPMVDTAEQAAEAVRAVHYPPRGRRGVGSALARSARWNRVEDYLTQADTRVSLVVQVETAEAVENAAAIAAVDGVDGILVGPADLAAAMGLLGQQSHPDVVAAVRRTFEAAHSVGTPVGVNAFDPDQAQAYVEAGADFIIVGADVTIVARGTEALARRWSP